MPEQEQEETTEQLSAEEIAAAEVAKAEQAETTEEVKDKTWAELGLNERFDGMSREEIASDILHRNTVHARQADEVGQLRKDLANAEQKIAGVKKAADLPTEVKAEVKKMSEAELARWLEDLQTDPHTAVRSLLGDSYGRRSEEELAELVDKRVNEGLQGYHGYTQDQRAMDDPDYQVAAPYIEYLQSEDQFGNTRPAMELLELWRLVMTDKPTADVVYDTMKRFPGVPMKNCIHMVNGRPKAAVDADKIRKQVKNLSGGGLPSGSKKVSTTEKIDDMDTAFDLDE